MARDKDILPLERAASNSSLQQWLQIGIAAALAAPAPVLRTLDITGVYHLGWPPLAESAVFGLGIFAAATLLVWASEVTEQLISATLALAILAIIAVLPEYAVDIYFAWTAHDNPENVHFALANMTGGNRLLIGLAWPVVFFLFFYKTRKTELVIGSQNSIALIFLALATIVSFSIPLLGSLSLIHSGALLSIFIVYLVLSARAPPHEAELFGPALAISGLPIRLRWGVVIGIFLFAAGTVFAAAEPFAEGLVHSGEGLGVDEFILVQWVAPLASESPEFILAGLLALRGRAATGMMLLISSKVNQWTLLVASLPIAYSVSGGSLDPLPVDARQAEEVFLTAAQSVFAIAVLMSLTFNRREATLILVLFLTQLFIPITEVRIGFGALYCLLAVVWLIVERREVPKLLNTAREELADPGAAKARAAEG